VFVINVVKATNAANLTGSVILNSVSARLAAACSPVRATESPDGSTLWVTARGGNEVLAFSVSGIETNPDSAFITTFSSGGQAPVGNVIKLRI
jgi:hypothetical protein